jgi:hypothetical protein
MVLRKVKKTVVYGSVLVAHYGADLTDKSTSSSSFSSWGDAVILTPQFDDSFLEVVLTGSAIVSENMPSGTSYGRLRILVNGQEEYMLDNLIGGYQQRSGDHTHQNQQFGENNARQNWRIYGSGTAIYVNHLHQPGTNNEQSIQCEVATSNSLNVTFAEGFMTVTELASEGYNLT